MRIPILLGLSFWTLAGAWAQSPSPADVSGAIQAIQQASDPSAVVAAYANGMAVSRNEPGLYEAYVARMVDLGLPELAYRQAQTLTTLQSTNGLAWGVVAYVNARQGQMPDAVSAINLAGQFAPDSRFVQRTAGEIAAWYDVKADPSKLPETAKTGLTKVRALLEKQSAFVDAYNTAKDAYKAQASAPQEPPAQTAEPGQYAPAPTTPAPTQPQGDVIAPLGYSSTAISPPPPPVYYSDYYYDYWGPNWVAPSPWWWWRPYGFFAGYSFIPYTTVFVFDHHKSKHHHHHGGKHHYSGSHHDQHFYGGRSFHRDGVDVTLQGRDRAFFHRNGQTSFFGTAARPNPSLALSLRDNVESRPNQVWPGRAGAAFARNGTTPGTVASPSSVTAPAPGLVQSGSRALPPTGRAIGSEETVYPNGVRPAPPSSVSRSARSSFAQPRPTDPGAGGTIAQRDVLDLSGQSVAPAPSQAVPLLRAPDGARPSRPNSVTVPNGTVLRGGTPTFNGIRPAPPAPRAMPAPSRPSFAQPRSGIASPGGMAVRPSAPSVSRSFSMPAPPRAMPPPRMPSMSQPRFAAPPAGGGMMRPAAPRMGGGRAMPAPPR